MLIGGDPLPNGTKVSFTVSGLSGTGVIRGIHQIPQAILGTGYIVERSRHSHREIQALVEALVHHWRGEGRCAREEEGPRRARQQVH